MILVVVDLGFGDGGKGTVCDWLCETQPVHTVVRFNGGAQAAHTVVRPGVGKWHQFSQFGSGTFAGTRTLLARDVLVNPLAMLDEANALAGLGVTDAALSLVTVDPRCLLTTPWHILLGRLRELRLGHGSCGQGIGATMGWALEWPDSAPLVEDIGTPRLRAKLAALAEWVDLETGAYLGPDAERDPWLRGLTFDVDDIVRWYSAWAHQVSIVEDATYLFAAQVTARPKDQPTFVFEGAQGALLDQWRGFHPHTTWSTTTTANADRILAEIGWDGTDPDEVRRVGVCRTYMTRHGAGPFVTEDPTLANLLPELHNQDSRGTGPWRVGHLDLVALNYGVDANGGLDALAVTHVDREGLTDVCYEYAFPTGERVPRLPLAPSLNLAWQIALTENLGLAEPIYSRWWPKDGWATMIADALQVPLWLESSGPTYHDKRVRCRLLPAR